MNARLLCIAAGLAVALGACSASGTTQPADAPSTAGYVPGGPTAAGDARRGVDVTSQAPPVPALSLDLKPLSNLTHPILDDAGSYPGGAIVVGANTAANGTGVQGVASGLGGYGLQGLAQTAGYIGVYGKATSNGAYGVYGYGLHGTGVRGYSADAGAYGGYFSNGAGGTALIATAAGNGVDGATTFASAEGGGAAGVIGEDDSNDGGNGNAGILGTSNSGLGVEGISQSGAGVTAVSSSAIACNSGGGWPFCPPAAPALFVQAPNSSPTLPATRGMEMIAQTSTGTPVMSLDGAGDMILSGDLIVDGTIAWGGLASTSCDQSPGTCAGPQIATQTRGGRTGLPVERTGDAQLVAGRAYVQLDAGMVARMDAAQGYHVFVTPNGDCNGLYVTDKTRGGFSVRELRGGTSTLAFDYRVVGTAAGSGGGRLPRPAEFRGLRIVHRGSVR